MLLQFLQVITFILHVSALILPVITFILHGSALILLVSFVFYKLTFYSSC